MKYIILSLTLFSASLVHAAERHFSLATPVVVLMPHVLNNIELLEVTPEQRHEIRVMANKMTREREDNESLTLELRKELWELTTAYRPDPKEQAKLIELISKAEKRRVEMSIECAGNLSKILNKDQWQLLNELASDRH